MEITTRAGDFEGPIEVLLKLVTTSEVDLYEISLTEIVNAFCAQIQKHQDDLEQITQFLVPAAILVELKSRHLLPDVREYDLAEELAIYGDRDVVLAKLIEQHTFAAAARRLRVLLGAAAQHYQRNSGADERFLLAAPDPLKGIVATDIAVALQSALARPIEPTVDITHIAAPPVTVEQCAYELVKQLPDCGPISFQELTEHITERVIVVAHFLALLELFKLGHIDLTQSERFGDIGIVWVSDSAEVDLTQIRYTNTEEFAA